MKTLNYLQINESSTVLNSPAVVNCTITVLCLIYEHIYLGILVPVNQGVSCVFIRARYTQIL